MGPVAAHTWGTAWRCEHAALRWRSMVAPTVHNDTSRAPTTANKPAGAPSASLGGASTLGCQHRLDASGAYHTHSLSVSRDTQARIHTREERSHAYLGAQRRKIRAQLPLLPVAWCSWRVHERARVRSKRRQQALCTTTKSGRRPSTIGEHFSRGASPGGRHRHHGFVCACFVLAEPQDGAVVPYNADYRGAPRGVLTIVRKCRGAPALYVRGREHRHSRAVQCRCC